MTLSGRNAIVYGAGGGIGGAMSRAFAAAGARVHLVGRTPATLDAVAAGIHAAGGLAEIACLDAVDERAVDDHADAVAERFGSLDISVNVITHGDVQGHPLVELAVADFERPVTTALRTTFLTTRAAGRHMIRQRSGVILMFGGYGDPAPNLGGLQVAFAVQDAMRRTLACELGPYGVRVVTLQTGGIPQTLPADFPAAADITADIVGRTMLGRAATLADVGAVAVFAASDQARTLTATAINITCGTEVD